MATWTMSCPESGLGCVCSLACLTLASDLIGLESRYWKLLTRASLIGCAFIGRAGFSMDVDCLSQAKSIEAVYSLYSSL